MRTVRHFLRRNGPALGLCALFLLGSRALRAEPGGEPLGVQRYRTPVGSSADYWHTFGSLSLGEGLRFNNPYRLPTSLGDTPESLSLTAPYYDISLGAVRGPPDGLASGATLHLSIAAQGIPQEVLSLSYIGLQRFGEGRTMLFGRAGIPIILEPDLNGGLEAAFGGAFLVSAGIGVQAELVGSLYYGAGTLDRSVTTIPVLSGELGVFFDYEVLK